MATLIVNIPDDIKTRWQKKCDDRALSMTKLILSWINADLNDGNFEKFDGMGAAPCKCLACGFDWIPNRPNPVACPACKSYKWNDAEFAEKRQRKIERRGEKDNRRMFNEFYAHFERIQKLTEWRSSPEVARKIGITHDELNMYIKEEKPVTQDIINRMQAVK